MAIDFARRHVVEVVLVALVTVAVAFWFEPPDAVVGQFRFVLYGVTALFALTLAALLVALVVTPAILQAEEAHLHATELSTKRQAMEDAQRKIQALEDQERRRRQLNVDVAVAAETRRAVDTSDEARDQWLEGELQRYTAAGSRSRSRDVWATMGFPDTRSGPDYHDEVHDYLEAAKRYWLDGLAVEAVRRELAPLTIELRNAGEVVARDVTLTVVLPAEARAYVSFEAADAASNFPEPVPVWGDSRFPHISGVTAPPPAVPAAVEVTDDAVSVRYRPLDLLPGDRRPLHRIYLLIPGEWAGTELVAKWRATGAGNDRPEEGSVGIPVARYVSNPTTLLEVN